VALPRASARRSRRVGEPRKLRGIMFGASQRMEEKVRPARVVAFVTDAIYPYHCGGKELRYHELMRQLANHAEVHVYTMKWWDGPNTVRTESGALHAICRHHPLYSGQRRSLKQAVFFAFACLRLMSARFDVLEADHMPYVQLPILRLVAMIKRKRFVVTWHEAWGREYWRAYLGVLGNLAWQIERLSMRLPDHIIAASPQTAEKLRAGTRGRKSISVAPNGIDLDAVRAAKAVGEQTDIVVVGRLIGHKRVDMLLDAIALLHASGCPVTCRVIGDGPDREALYSRAQALNVGSAVEFLHDVRDYGELYGLMKSSRLFVFPSAREGFGIAVLEAIACDLPVVTTAAPDNLARHLVAESGQGIVAEDSISGLAAAIRTVLDDTKSALEMRGLETTEWLAGYSWTSTAEAVASALET
jgi:glycosyltransferase involved in cell wall biosynthesis